MKYYNHSDNAGSVFDTFKHAILLKAVERKQPDVYFETHCGFSSYSKPEIWESSWAKVHRTKPIEMILCDTNPEVGKTVPSYDTFTFYNENGFSRRLRHKGRGDARRPPDFTFIDPPYVEDSDWIDVAMLCDLIKNWVVWYPIFVTGQKLDIKAGACIEMLWQTDHKMPGCGMAFSKDFDNDDLQFIYNCVPFMAWSLSAISWTRKDYI